MRRSICIPHAANRQANGHGGTVAWAAKPGLAVRAKWSEWLGKQVAKYEWEIDPDDVKGPTIHGLRGTGVLTRWADGYDADQISNDIGMSRQMVDHYMRFRDQTGVAADWPEAP